MARHRVFRRSLAPASVLLVLLIVAVSVGLVESTVAAPIATLLVVMVIVQWSIGPRLIQRLIPAEEIRHDGQRYETDHALGTIVARRCSQAGVPFVRLGIVDDRTPNAFTFGHTRRDARLWVTRGLLEWLDADELDAVVSHEIGHVRHGDFVVMTIASVVPLLLYAVARGLLDADGDNDGGEVQLVGLGLLLLYFASEFVVLWLSRAREFGADHWSCECTGNGDALVSALVKVAYGMAVDTATEPSMMSDTKHTKRTAKRDARQRDRRDRIMAMMGILDDSASAGLTNGFVAGIDTERAVAALRWEALSPWARVLEKLSTHPLVGRRIAALEASELEGRPRSFGLDVKKVKSANDAGKRLRSQFVVDVVALFCPWLTLTASIVLLIASSGREVVAGVLLAMAGLLLLLAQTRRYPSQFEPVDAVTTLLERLDAGPVRGIPVAVRGRTIGRATPGYVLSADLVLQDASGLVALDYRQPLPGADTLFGFKRARTLIGRDVIARGWYRRSPYPSIELRELRTHDGECVRPYLWRVRFVTAAAIMVTGLIVTVVQVTTTASG